jgi:ssDNA-binding Zn-finger/Zn-ribbon topoisomerase 1
LHLIPSARLTEPARETNSESRPEEAGPKCANCGSQLRRMTNRYDSSNFWGCNNPNCNWTFDDPPSGQTEPKCGRGHAMILRSTVNGTRYWACSRTSCSRKRLATHPSTEQGS